jgi:UDP-GlcNAc3NAcA epimerase
MNIATVVGARPQFVKAAVVSRALHAHGLHETLIHTGQHYDAQMSDIFFTELGLPVPARHLGIGGLSHGAMTGRMLEALEQEFQQLQPDWVLVYGDTNSTLAAALAAAKLHIPIAHVEAGLRSFNRQMPEEINRVMTDHVSTLLFTPSATADANLAREGITQGVQRVGDVMYDATLRFLQPERLEALRAKWGLPEQYAILTLHREENTGDRPHFQHLLDALGTLSHQIPIYFPIHPRTQKVLDTYQMSLASHIHPLESLGYLDMLALVHGACLVLTDSGGLQKEAFYLQRPCITLRPETEWVETLENGWNQLLKDPQQLTALTEEALRQRKSPLPHPYGQGQSATLIAAHFRP